MIALQDHRTTDLPRLLYRMVPDARQGHGTGAEWTPRQVGQVVPMWRAKRLVGYHRDSQIAVVILVPTGQIRVVQAIGIAELLGYLEHDLAVNLLHPHQPPLMID